MLKKMIAAGFALTLTTLPVLAFDIDQMTEAERESFRAEIRAYLLDNPDIIMEAIEVLETRRNEAAEMQDRLLLVEHDSAIFNDGYSWVTGNPEGDVTIVEFLDYRCGYCKRAHPAVVELLATDRNIKMIVKEFPILGPESELASRYAIATMMTEGDEAYQRVHDALMEWKGPINEGALARIGRNAGVNDQTAVLGRMKSPEVTGVIAKNRSLARALGINGTPSFIMGDSFVRGFLELDHMREIVDNIRADQG